MNKSSASIVDYFVKGNIQGEHLNLKLSIIIKMIILSYSGKEEIIIKLDIAPINEFVPTFSLISLHWP